MQTRLLVGQPPQWRQPRAKKSSQARARFTDELARCFVRSTSSARRRGTTSVLATSSASEGQAVPKSHACLGKNKGQTVNMDAFYAGFLELAQSACSGIHPCGPHLRRRRWTQSLLQKTAAASWLEVRFLMSIEQDIVTLLSGCWRARLIRTSPEDIRDPYIVYSVIYGAGFDHLKAIPAPRICACNPDCWQLTKAAAVSLMIPCLPRFEHQH